MTRKSVVLVTGAGGEMGHGLITRLAELGTFDILALDVRPLDPEVRGTARRPGSGTSSIAICSTGSGASSRSPSSSTWPRCSRRGPSSSRRPPTRSTSEGTLNLLRLAVDEAALARPPGEVPLPQLDRGLRTADLGNQADGGPGGRARMAHARRPCTAATSSTASTSAATSPVTTGSSRPRPSRAASTSEPSASPG